jgi:hypothetical protein
VSERADDELGEILEQLQTCSEALADRAIAVLQRAVASGATKRPAAERQLTRARTAVDRAISLLRSSEAEPVD